MPFYFYPTSASHGVQCGNIMSSRARLPLFKFIFRPWLGVTLGQV